METAQTAEPESAEAKEDPGELSGAIELSHVSFRYDADGPEVLQTVGYLQFVVPDDGRNLWDLRRGWLVASDYPTINAQSASWRRARVSALSLEWSPPLACPAGGAKVARGDGGGDVRGP